MFAKSRLKTRLCQSTKSPKHRKTLVLTSQTVSLFLPNVSVDVRNKKKQKNFSFAAVEKTDQLINKNSWLFFISWSVSGDTFLKLLNRSLSLNLPLSWVTVVSLISTPTYWCSLFLRIILGNDYQLILFFSLSIWGDTFLNFKT